MLYTKFQGHWPLGSEEGDFRPNIPWRLNMKFASISLVFFEEKKFENVESE